MTEHRVQVEGRGRVEVTAHGVADAEHRVEIQIGRLWPAARVRVTGVERLEADDRLVGAFEVRYAVAGEIACAAETPEALRREAFRQARRKLEGSPFRTVEWTRAIPQEGAAS